MNPKHAHYMMTVVQEGSITAAAKKLYVSQPSLSQMIKLIETELGAAIFNRSTDPITLTYAGEKYIAAAKQVLMIDKNLKKEIQEIKQEEYGILRLGIPVQRAMEILPIVFPVFRSRYPNVELEITEVGSGATEELLRDGKLDIACLTSYPRFDDLHYTLVNIEEPVLLAARDSNIAGRIAPETPISITEAKDEAFVFIKTGHSIRYIQEHLFNTYEIHPKPILVTSSIEVGKRVAIACHGVMICPRNYIKMSPEIMSECVMYPINGIVSQRHFYICHRRDSYLRKYTRAFISIVLRCFGDDEVLKSLKEEGKWI